MNVSFSRERGPNPNPIVLPLGLVKESIGPNASARRKDPSVFDSPKHPRDPGGRRALAQVRPNPLARAWSWCLKTVGRWLYDVKVEGKPYDGGGHVLASSHEGLLDGLVVTGLDARVKAVAFPPVVKLTTPIFRASMHMIEEGENYFDAVRKPRQGLVTWLAADGNMHGNLPAGVRSGAARIANAARVPVQVMSITGTKAALEQIKTRFAKNWYKPWRWFPKERPEITVHYGKVIWPFEETVKTAPGGKRSVARKTKPFHQTNQEIQAELERLLTMKGYAGLPPERAGAGIFTSGRLPDAYMTYKESARAALAELVRDLEKNPRPKDIILTDSRGPVNGLEFEGATNPEVGDLSWLKPGSETAPGAGPGSR